MNLKKAAIVLAFFFAFWFGLLSLSGSLTSGFHLTDDHQIITYSETLKHSGALSTAADWIADDVRVVGRFLPLYYFHRLIQVKLFGADFLLWAIYDAVLASLSSSFFAFFMLSAGFTLFEAILLPLLLFLGFQTGIWWRFGTAETIGMLIMSVMLCAAASGAKRKRRILDVGFIVSGILLMLAKETFILFIPALVFIKVWLGKREARLGWPGAFRREALSVAVLLSLVAVEILFIKFFVGTTGIGYAGYEGFSVGPFVVALVNYLYGSQAFLAAAAFLLAVSVLPREKRRMDDIVAVFIVVFLSLAPQTVLHAKSGVSERYLLPGIFGMVFATVYFLRLAREGLAHGRPRFGAPVLAAWAGALVFVLVGAYMIAGRKLSITFNLGTLTLLSDVEPVPLLSFATSWLHAFTQKAFPWVAGAALVVFAAAGRSGVLSSLLNQRTYIAFITLWATLFAFSIGFDNAFHSAFQGRATNGWLSSIEENTGKDDAILVVADPAVNNEWALAVRRYLTVHSGRTNLYAHPVLTRGSYNPFERSLAESFGLIYGRDIDAIADLSSLKAVAIMPNAEDAFLADSASWFDPAAYDRYVNMYGFVGYYRP